MFDTIINGLKTVGKAIVAGAKLIGAAIAKAGTAGLVKVGVVAGAAGVTVALAIKFLIDKKKSYTNQESMIPLERALQWNYYHPYNQIKLHPGMAKVQKQLMKGAKRHERRKMEPTSKELEDDIKYFTDNIDYFFQDRPEVIDNYYLRRLFV